MSCRVLTNLYKDLIFFIPLNFPDRRNCSPGRLSDMLTLKRMGLTNLYINLIFFIPVNFS